MTGKDDNYRGPAVRALCQITDVSATFLSGDCLLLGPCLLALSICTSPALVSHLWPCFSCFSPSLCFPCNLVNFPCIPLKELVFVFPSLCRVPCCRPLSATWSRRLWTRCPVYPALPWFRHWYVCTCRDLCEGQLNQEANICVGSWATHSPLSSIFTY